MKITISFLILCSVAYCTAKTLPDFIEKCKEDDAKVNECITDKANLMMSKIGKGLKKHKIPSLTPFHFEKMTMNIGSMKLDLLNGDLTGIENFKAKSIELNKNDGMLHITGFIPELNIKAQYKSSGKLLILPIEGDGPFEGTYYDSDFKFSISMQNMNKDSKEPMKYNKCQLKFTYRDGKFVFENLFNGKKELGDPVNEMIQKEQHNIVETYQNDFSIIFCAFVDAVVKPVLDDMLYSEIFQ